MWLLTRRAGNRNPRPVQGYQAIGQLVAPGRALVLVLHPENPSQGSRQVAGSFKTRAWTRAWGNRVV